MAIIGYVRISPYEDFQTVEKQLKAAGSSRIYSEKIYGREEARPQLAALLDQVREGDTVVICRFNYFARNPLHLLQVIETLQHKGVLLRVLDSGIDIDDSAMGNALLRMLESIVQFQTEMIRERHQDGIRYAQANGWYKGRNPTARAKAPEVRRLTAAGKSRAAVAKELGIGVASVYRILAAAKKEDIHAHGR